MSVPMNPRPCELEGWVNAGARLAMHVLLRAPQATQCRGCSFPRCHDDHRVNYAAVPWWAWWLALVEESLIERLPAHCTLTDTGVNFQAAWRELARGSDLAEAWCATMRSAYPYGWTHEDGRVLTAGMLIEWPAVRFLRGHFPWPLRWPE